MDFMFFTPEDLPPEVREQMERHRMQHSEVSHSVYRLMDDLTDEQMEALGNIIRTISNDESAAPYFLGIIASKMSQRTGACLACNKNHDREANDLFAASHADGPNTADPTTDTTEPEKPAHGSLTLTPEGPVVNMQDATDPERSHAVPLDALLPMAAESLGNRIAKMVEYHVEPVEDGDYDGAVKCTGINGLPGPCGMTYPNLNDRMLRGPEHCSGCFARAGQG